MKKLITIALFIIVISNDVKSENLSITNDNYELSSDSTTKKKFKLLSKIFPKKKEDTDSLKLDKKTSIMADKGDGLFYEKEHKNREKIHVLPRRAMNKRSFIINGTALCAMTVVVIDIFVHIIADFTIKQTH